MKYKKVLFNLAKNVKEALAKVALLPGSRE